VWQGNLVLSPTLRKEHNMKVLENRVLTRVFRPKRDARLKIIG
jgi:hypothetical protein